MDSNTVVNKSFAFAARVVELYKWLTFSHKDLIISKQLLRCGTSIGANIAEAQHAQSRADFHAKMNIALKEASETEYWLRLLYKTRYLTRNQFLSLHSDISELLRLLISICKTTDHSAL